jgi:SMC interacting uncharacterized protein involved in chromosome segregation
MDEKIVEFRPSDMEVALKPRDYSDRLKDCVKCKDVWLDEHKRELECRRCGKILDPIKFLWDTAREAENWMGSIERLKVEFRQKSDELTDLKRQISNARATLKRQA